jgi:23S rRNA (uracil1939-C5)-methyltransferase
MNSGGAKPAAQLSSTTLHIDDLLANGQGVGRDDGLVVFVTGALPGEDVRVAVDEVHRNYASARAVEILHPSPDRRTSVCPVFPRCGGCQTLHLDYAAQLRWKQRMVSDAVQRIGGFSAVAIAQAVPSDFVSETRYRNKASLVCRAVPAKPAIGFYAARSHRLVGIDHCPVLLPRLDEAVRALAALAPKAPKLLLDVRHIVLRTDGAQRSHVLALSTGSRRADLQTFVSVLRERIPSLTGIVSSWSPANANAILGTRSETLWGSPQIEERIGGATFQFGIGSFFQINSSMLERIAAVMRDRLQGYRRIVDLYSGVGTFAVLAGMQGAIATGVESVPAAVDEAATNAAHNGVTSAAFECATASEAVSGDRGRSLLAGCDAVVLDPPRRGCEPEVLDALCGARISKVLYLSCNPTTLARDARRLAAGGYGLRSVAPFDMFPYTGHVESLAEFAFGEMTPATESPIA